MGVGPKGTLGPDRRPGRGKDEHARGFPVCTATIDYPGRGYRGFFGWVQRVRSTDNTVGRRAFEMDPARFFEDSPAPYCWYGFKPVLFGAPSRDRSLPLDWLAHSFLAFTPRGDDARKQIVPLLGFSWGFAIAITVRSLSRLSVDSRHTTGRTTLCRCASATRDGSSHPPPSSHQAPKPPGPHTRPRS
jgi:hypothetical protein